MHFRTLLMALVVAALAAAGSSAAQTTGEDAGGSTTIAPAPPPADMPLWLFKDRRRSIQARINRLRAKQCVGGAIRLRHPLSVLAWRRRERVAVWRLRTVRRFLTDTYCLAPAIRHAAGGPGRWRYPSNMSAWSCIHGKEGAWKDPNAPYWGGLQMDLAFQHGYGYRLPAWKGTADRWLPIEQIWTAEHARRSGRGYYPWPRTARACGLI